MLNWLAQIARRLHWLSGASPAGSGSNEFPKDPYSYVRHPLVHRPGGRNAAVALEEPDEDENLVLIGRQ